jgi:hypothetical protein
MIKNIMAIVAAAVCAGAMVEFIREPAPADAAGALPAARSHETIISASNKPAVFAAVRIAESGKAVCSQGWPYYEPPCLHDGRRADGKMRAVRVIITDRSVAGATSQTRR